MKQHITKKQWEELTNGQMVELVKSNLTTSHREGKEIKEWHSMAIGQLIEFLGEDWIAKINIAMGYAVDCEPPPNKELCNELWEAVKYKLK